MVWRTVGVVIVAVAVAVGCSREAGEKPAPPSSGGDVVANAGWRTVTAEDMTAEQQELQRKSQKAVQSMAKQLMGELARTLDEGGPVAAIDVCRTQAPVIAASISNEYGLVVGRTSFRLRNPANRAPEWAVDLVEKRVAGPTWLIAPDGRLGGLVPIRLKAECGMCHGPEAEISAEIRTAIHEGYPEDAATGFHEGDLRGWFWVEAAPTS